MNLKNGFCCLSSDADKSNKILLWELTNRCNLCCPYCHVDFDLKKDTLIEKERIGELLKEFKEQNFKTIIISGGEPLLYKDLWWFMEEASSLSFDLDICTNGTLLDDERVNLLSRYIKKITVTMDSFDEQIFNTMKGSNSAYKKVVSGLKRLIKNDFNINITIVTTKANYLHLESTVDQLFDLGIRTITFLNLYDFKHETGFEMAINEKDQLRKNIIHIAKKYESGGLILKTKGIFFADNDIGNCKAGYSIFGLDSKGYLLPCILLRSEHSQTDLKKNKLFDAMISKPITEFLKRKKEIKCLNCAYDSLCNKGCPAVSYLKTGEIMEDLRCDRRNKTE